MFYSADVRHERFWRVGIARNAVFFHSFVASKACKGRFEKRGGAKDRLLKMSTKFAPRLRARAIRKSKSLKTDGLGAFLEAQSAFRVAGAGISTRCKIRVRRRSSWGLQKRWQAWWIWRGSETMRFTWQAQWFRALWCRCLKPPTLNPWKSCKFHVTEVLLCSDHFAWQLQDFVCLGSTFSWQAQYFWSVHLKIVKTYWNSEAKCLLNMSILKEVSQKCFVFDLQSFIFEGSLAEMLRFWSSKFHFWRKSRTKASFLSFKASFLKEVSQKCFVFGLQSFNFEGSLAEKLRFWVSKLQFWRKSCRKASFDKIIWITQQLTTKSLEPQIIWHPNHLNLKSIDNQFNFDWQPNHLNLRSIDNRITWISNQLTTTSLEVQINRQPKSFESQIRWQPNHLSLNSFESGINWLSNQLNSARSLPIGSLSLETSATALCGRYVNSIATVESCCRSLVSVFHAFMVRSGIKGCVEWRSFFSWPLYFPVAIGLLSGLSYRLGSSAAGEFIFCLVRLPEQTAQAKLEWPMQCVLECYYRLTVDLCISCLRNLSFYPIDLQLDADQAQRYASDLGMLLGLRSESCDFEETWALPLYPVKFSVTSCDLLWPPVTCDILWPIVDQGDRYMWILWFAHRRSSESFGRIGRCLGGSSHALLSSDT